MKRSLPIVGKGSNKKMVYLNSLKSAIKMAEALLESGYAIHIKQIKKDRYELKYDLPYSVYKEKKGE